MKKRQKAPKVFAAKTAGSMTPGFDHLSIRFVPATLAVLLFSVIGAAATNTIYHGHIAVTRNQSKSPEANIKATHHMVDGKSAGVSINGTPDVIAKYGPAAKSPLVAAAIKKVETASGGTLSARQAADRLEAVQHGYWRPGASPVDTIMAGYLPPGMPPEQAAMLYGALPHTPVMPQRMTAERIAAMAGEPADPMGFSQNQIQAQNDQLIRSAMRERFGPVYVPPLHRDHQGSIREMTDNSGNIVAQYAYSPYGNATKLQGGMDSDFQYAGYYFHAPSGLSLTLNRAYSPVLGRFINRDPIGENGGINLYAYVGNEPIGRNDPSGLWQYHGNWGGPGWASGSNRSELSNFPPNPNYKGWAPPIDPVDRCYYWHDVCLHNAARDQNNGTRKCRRNFCDKDLSKCLQHVVDTYGWKYGSLGGEIGQFGQSASPNNNEGEYVPGLQEYNQNYDPGFSH